MQKSFFRFEEIFGFKPKTHGAAGWQMNAYALSQIDAWEMPYASDGRAPLNLVPYRVQLPSGVLKHIQYPTTLPTFDELLGVDDMDGNAAVNYLLNLTANNPNDQVFTLHAELEGQKLLPFFKKLLQGWIQQGHTCLDLKSLHHSWMATGQTKHLIQLPFMFGSVANRSGEMMVMPTVQ
jgi:hypothetical protein